MGHACFVSSWVSLLVWGILCDLWGQWAPGDEALRSLTTRDPKYQEAEALYQACVREANARQQELEAAKQRIVSHVRKLVLQGDEVLRRVRP